MAYWILRQWKAPRSRFLQGVSSKRMNTAFPQSFLVELLNFRLRSNLQWKREKGTELGLNRGPGLITYSPFEICAWGIINLEVCLRVSTHLNKDFQEMINMNPLQKTVGEMGIT